MGDGARRDRDIEEYEEIGKPEAAADGGGVFDRFFDFPEIVGLGGDGAKGRIFRLVLRHGPPAEFPLPRGRLRNPDQLRRPTGLASPAYISSLSWRMASERHRSRSSQLKWSKRR